MAARPELSLVIPIHNEEDILPRLDARLKELLGKLGASTTETEIVFVNDGSTDKSIDLLRRMASHELRYRVLGFSRHFGREHAITAGMTKSRGSAVIVMDDLQAPHDVILDLVAKWRAGFDVVFAKPRSGAGSKGLGAKIIHRIFASMIRVDVPLDAGELRLMSRRVVTTMRGLRETHRFVRGLVAWVGFKQTIVDYDRDEVFGGKAKHPGGKSMLAFAIDSVTSFSVRPLRLATYLGLWLGLGSVLYGLLAIIASLADFALPGPTSGVSTIVVMSFLFAVQLVMIGVLGEYIGRIYEQVKRRPLYVVSERINFGKRKTENLITQDIEDFQAPEDIATPARPVPPVSPAPAPAPAPERHHSPNFPAPTPHGPTFVADVPPPPAAIVAAVAAVEAANATANATAASASSPPARPSRPPPARLPSRAPPALPGPKQAPKLSSSVANMHVAPAVKSPTSQSSPPPKVVPSTPPGRSTSQPPPANVTPSTPPKFPSVPPKAAPAAPTAKPAASPSGATRTKSGERAAVNPDDTSRDLPKVSAAADDARDPKSIPPKSDPKSAPPPRSDPKSTPPQSGPKSIPPKDDAKAKDKADDAAAATAKSDAKASDEAAKPKGEPAKAKDNVAD